MKKDLELISKNLAHIEERSKKDINARKYWISQLIKLIKKNGFISYSDISQILRDADAFSVKDILTAAKELRAENQGEIHGDISLEIHEKRPYIVSNFRNVLSEQTYGHFFGDKEFRIIEKDSFIDLFEDVYNERANYCIIPIENTSSGKLLNFYSLIANYNLKILSVCDVEHSGQDAYTRFALLSRPPINLLTLDQKEYCFEISISSRNEDALPRLLEAASICKIHPKRIDSVPFTHLRDEYSYYIVFRIEADAAFFDFLVFLSIEGVSFTPIGIFK
ncbi:MAG: hypothetical protein IJZ89_01120 [Clostridia bacterium]|nr:hypothetical protein [Clostridia bacterium]